MHRIWVSNGSELSRSFEANLVFETEICQGAWLRNLQYQRFRKENKQEAKAGVEKEEEGQEAPVSLITLVINILHSLFSNVEVYINNQQIYNSNGLYAHKSYISTTFREQFLITRGFALWGIWLWKISWWTYGSAFLWNFFHKDNENA